MIAVSHKQATEVEISAFVLKVVACNGSMRKVKVSMSSGWQHLHREDGILIRHSSQF